MDSEKREHLKKEMKGIAWGAFALFLLIALLSFKSDDPTFNTYSTSAPRNWGGRVGAILSDLAFQGFGLAAYTIPFLLGTISYKLLRFKEIAWRYYRWGAILIFTLTLATLFAFFKDKTIFLGQTVSTGGALGSLIADGMKSAFGKAGSLLALFTLLASSVMILARLSFVAMADGAAALLKEQVGKVQARLEQQRQSQAIKAATSPPASPKEVPIPPITTAAATPVVEPVPLAIKKNKKRDGTEAPPSTIAESIDFVKSDGPYQTPGLSLLDQPNDERPPVDRELLATNAGLLEKKFKDFGVTGEVVEILPGPVITMYEYAPGPGVKLNRVAGLSDDLSMALQAHSIRIIAPIPGKGVVGIELPNRQREMVFLREIFTCDDFHRGKMKLPLALGKDIAGLPVVTDLARMPHLLVAGATGSGKSVSINTMILSLLYTATPHDVRVIMVDPKMLELSIYEGIPHLLLPVVTNPKKAAMALKWAVKEMERRYRLMADKGVRNIDSYNKKFEQEQQELEKNRQDEVLVVDVVEEDLDGPATVPPAPAGETLDHAHLPYLVVIVDELADLMMVAGREIEESIARLAQMARAAGIHLILATQRPSVDVITGLIKANFPARISFQVSSKIDSRTILDCNGAEALLGAGDMLFLPPGTSKLQRIHGAFVSDAEVQRVVEFLKIQAKPVYDNTLLEMKESDDTGSDPDEEVDECYDKAVAIVAEARQASISMVQRRLRIGYNRAARIIERMEQEGIVGPSDGTSKPREVYVNRI